MVAADQAAVAAAASDLASAKKPVVAACPLSSLPALPPEVSKPTNDQAGGPGAVALVGAGPGDPELLTVKALRRLQNAQVVLYDNLLCDDVLGLVPADAELVNVGKKCGDTKDRGLQQKEINDLLVLHYRRGRRVVRLKCGDPLIFGRGGEELEHLAQHGITAEVVPGITTALGAAATCQMPLTHRSCSNQLRLICGQSQARSLPELGWADLAQSAGKQTVVFYMGLKMLGDICERLRQHGVSEETPMAVVENATFPNERLVTGTVASMPKIAEEAFLGKAGPSIIFMGPTVGFPSSLDTMFATALPEAERPAKRPKTDSVAT
eukprot:TRINITY_DN111924_c0_g1_i1.p1 TRINITY_DN111924_c0_g1~~TRINITY_DN111924_c0_g1_i1.p1  ORF type:complete len:323 (+),score=80.21 TRINITY_DN111924_c0_g1_i1:56-1024(+)